MKPITSRDNPFYKELKQLATSSQARRKSGRTLLDGIHLCQSYLQHKGNPAWCIVGESALHHPEVQGLVQACDPKLCICLPDNLFSALSQVEHGIDILFVIDTPQAQIPPELRRSAVLLDQLQDPGNMGSILRSAAAAGIKDVFCASGTVFAWAPKVLRAGMGAHFLLNIYENVNLEQLVANAAVEVVATSSHAKETIYSSSLKQELGWLFGHEGQGVSDNLLQLANRTLTIPHLGPVESLNVAACAAVCFFEQLRQRTSVY